jgi:hypothetical protein
MEDMNTGRPSIFTLHNWKSNENNKKTIRKGHPKNNNQVFRGKKNTLCGH